MAISIVMPSYNREAYLARTIESIIAQTEKDWELIIVDDGSTDDSKILYDFYTKKDKRIKVIYLPKNMGIAAARNAGCKEAKGEYIAVMDSDDMMVNGRLKESLKAIKNADFVYSPYLVNQNGEAAMVDCPDKVTFEDIKRNGSYPHVTIMARKKCFMENPYREDFRVNDDAWLVWKWFEAGYKAKKVKYPLVYVTLHEGNTSKTKAEEIAKTQKIMDGAYENSRNN